MAAGFLTNQIVLAEEGQTVITTSKPYVSGTLLVFLNGLLTKIGADNDYTETDETHIQFNYPLNAGDTVNLASLQSSEGMSVAVIGSNWSSSNALYFKYSTATKLKYNQKYGVQLCIKDKTYNFGFTSKFNPYYSTIKKVRLDTGDLLNGATDEQISFIIYLSSKDAKDLVDAQVKATNDTSDTALAALTKAANSWTRYKTDMDLVNAIYLSLTGVSGRVSKKLGGDIQVDREVKLPGLRSMLERFQQLFNPYDQTLRSAGASSSQVFVKAGTTNTYAARGKF